MTHDERGAAGMFVVALMGVVLLLGLSAAFLVATAAAHRRAQAAADLAALAGAVARQEGRDGCAMARVMAGRNGASVTLCGIESDDVVVHVEVPSPEFLGHRWRVAGTARAGPG